MIYLRLPHTGLVGAVEIMVCAVMVYRVTAQVAQAVNIPCGIIGVSVQAIADFSACDFLISHSPPMPQAQVANDQNGGRKLHIQVHALIVQIITVDFIHQGNPFLLGQIRVIRFQIVFPFIVIQIKIAPDDVSVLAHRASPRSLCFGRIGWPLSS